MTEVFKFEHEAMKTTFTIRIVKAEADRAEQASRVAFQRLEELEAILSRYAHGSDVWQINHMRSGDSLLINQDCYNCLKLALQASVNTSGLFDPTLGKRIEHFKQGRSGEAPPLEGQLMIDPDSPRVHCVEAGREIDLGGIGKGYALDCMAECLREWDIDSALLAAGASTQLAMGETAWTIELSGNSHTESLELKRRALSASGSGIQGAHILFPGDDHDRPLSHSRIWVIHENAALADAWSTAAILVSPEVIMSFESPPPELIFETENSLHHLSAKS